jgi:hypothetical protein
MLRMYLAIAFVEPSDPLQELSEGFESSMSNNTA